MGRRSATGEGEADEEACGWGYTAFVSLHGYVRGAGGMGESLHRWGLEQSGLMSCRYHASQPHESRDAGEVHRPGGSGRTRGATFGTVDLPAGRDFGKCRATGRLADNPKDRQELTAFFLEALGKYRVAAAKVGRTDDVGHALAVCLACNYGVANGCDVPDDRLNALARQMDVALADMPGFREASDAERQTVAETFVMLGMFVAAGYEQSGNNAGARAAFVELAESSFRSLTGLDVRSVTLTARGMRVK